MSADPAEPSPSRLPSPRSPYFQLRCVAPLATRNRTAQALLWTIPAPVLLAVLVASGSSTPSRSDLAAILGISGLVFIGICLLAWTCRAVDKTIDDVTNMLNARQQRKMAEALERRFSPFLQHGVAAGFVVFGLAWTLALQPAVNGALWWLFMFQSLIGWLLNGYGLAFALSTLGWLSTFDSLGSLKLGLVPARTPGLRSASRLAGLIALLFTLQTVMEITLFFLIDWKSAVAVRIAIYVLMFPLGVLALGLLLYPQAILRRIVRAAKKKSLDILEGELQRLRLDQVLLSPARLDLSLSLLDLHSKIMRSPATPADLGTALRYAPSIAVVILPFFVDEAQIRTQIHAWFT